MMWFERGRVTIVLAGTPVMILYWVRAVTIIYLVKAAQITSSVAKVTIVCGEMSAAILYRAVRVTITFSVDLATID